MDLERKVKQARSPTKNRRMQQELRSYFVKESELSRNYRASRAWLDNWQAKYYNFSELIRNWLIWIFTRQIFAGGFRQTNPLLTYVRFGDPVDVPANSHFKRVGDCFDTD